MKQLTYLFILFSLIFSGCNNNLDKIPNDYLGNFYDKTGKEYWAFGVQNDFFISDCQFWEYKKIKLNGNKLSFFLQNKLLEKQIDIVKTDSINFEFTENGETIYCSKNKDTIKRLAKNNPFSMDTGTVAIKGYVKNFQKYYETDSRMQFIFSNYLVSDTKSIFADIDSLGRFNINVKIMHASSFLMKYRNELTEIFASPNDQLFISMDADSLNQLVFMGEHSDVCYDIIKTNEALYDIEPGQQRESAYAKTPTEFRSYREFVLQKQKEFLKDYLKNNNCSEVFKIWFIKGCQNDFFRELMSYTGKRFGRGSEKHISYKDPNLSFIDSIDLNDSLAPITYNYFFFTMSLEKKMDSRDDINNQTFYLQKKNELKAKNPKLSDSEVNTELYQLSFIRKIDLIKSHEYSKFSDIRLTVALSEIIEWRQYDLIDYAFDRVKIEIKYKPFLNAITEFYNDFKKKEEEFKNTPVSLKKTSDKGELLFQDIVNRNKGKAIVIDFWFTGCGACRSDFKSMTEIKKNLIGEDVVFVYLCYQSTESNWSNVIKEYNIQGEHYLLTDNQYSFFAKKFNINYAPRYILINKAGLVVNSNFRPPMNPDQYLIELRNNLNR